MDTLNNLGIGFGVAFTPLNLLVAAVGAFLGIWNGRTMLVGSLCDISLHKLADGQQSGPATGRVDLLGEMANRQRRRPAPR